MISDRFFMPIALRWMNLVMYCKIVIGLIYNNQIYTCLSVFVIFFSVVSTLLFIRGGPYAICLVNDSIHVLYLYDLEIFIFFYPMF